MTYKKYIPVSLLNLMKNIDIKVMPLGLIPKLQQAVGNIVNQIGSLEGKICECCLI